MVAAGGEGREAGEESGIALEVPGSLPRRRERDVALVKGALEPKDRRIRELVLDGVFSGRLAQRRRRLRDIEEVVGDLEEESEGFPVTGYIAKPARVRTRVERPKLEGQADEPPRFQGMDATKQPGALGVLDRRARRREVEGLPAGHPLNTDRPGRPRHRARAPRRARVARWPRREELETERLQRIAREKRRRFTEDDVTRGPPAAQRVVVHAGQIVVNERVRVEKLERRGRLDRVVWKAVGPAGLGSREKQQRPQPLAAGKNAVSHRGDEIPGLRSLGRKDREERAFHVSPPALQSRRKMCGGLSLRHRFGSSPPSTSSSSSSSRGPVTSASGVSFRTTSTRFSISSMRPRQKRDNAMPSSKRTRLASSPFSGSSSSVTTS